MKSRINRRNFILGSLAVVGANSAASIAAHSHKKTSQDVLTADIEKAAGISDGAYMKARARAAALVAKMTLAEKISQTGNTAPAIKRLGLSSYQYWSEALHGLCIGYRAGTSFPQPLALAGAWNPELTRLVYAAISSEARAWHNRTGNPLTFYSPQTLNLHRDPRWGRCEEALGEDCCLASTLVTQVVKGMQGDNPTYLKTAACAKHFICNNTDDDRMRVSASVSPRNFWEYYTRSFRAAVIDGGVFTVMGAYNSINGIPCCADQFLLTDLLRHRWGFRGYVTSDCDAVYNIYNPHHYVQTLHQAAAAALQAGCDLNCGTTMPDHLMTAVSDELVSEADIGCAVTRLLTVRMLLGEFDPPENVPYGRIPFDVVNSSEHRALALQAAQQSIILLKNQSNFLPINKNVISKIAVIGPMAGASHLGQYSGVTYESVSPIQGIAAALGLAGVGAPVWPDRALKFNGVSLRQELAPWRKIFSRVTDGAWVEYEAQNFDEKTSIAIDCTGGRGGVITVHVDTLENPAVASVLVPNLIGTGVWKSFSSPLRAVIGKHKMFFKIHGDSGSLMDIGSFSLLPLVGSSGELNDSLRFTYKQGCSVRGRKVASMFADAAAAARQADIVIMVCGVDSGVDGEGHDRHDTYLPGAQHELIKACYQANPKMVLVLNTNNTVAIKWEQENLPAIVAALYGGQAQGTAIADVLFGNYNPGGKTCCTWYKSVDQLPPFHNYDIMKGRTYLYFEGEPLYPFGYGLSYTTFHISDLHVDSKELSATKPVNVSCRVKNIGTRAGAEVVQFYITVPKSPVKRPLKELVGFQRVELKPGESRRVTFTLPYNAQALWYWHESQRKFILQPGALKLMIGNSSADIALTGVVALKSCTDDALGVPKMLETVAVPVEVA